MRERERERESSGFVADYVSKMADYVVDRLNVWVLLVSRM